MELNRTKIIVNNILQSAGLKVLSLGISFFAVPISLNAIGEEKYGVWITLLSVISWFSMMDIGLGNGYRNKLAEAVSQNNRLLAKELASTSYVLIFIISLIIFIVASGIIPFINWNKIFNTIVVENNELALSIFISISFFCVNFILSINNQSFYAIQQSSMTGYGQVVSSVLTVMLLLICINFFKVSLSIFSLIYGISSLTSNVFMTAVLFFKNHQLIPSLKHVKRSHINGILNLGLKFFIMQIAVIVIFSATNMVITQLISPSAVTNYSLLQKLFSVISIGASMVMAPLWSAFTDAFIKKDSLWIRKILHRLEIFIIPTTITIIILTYFCNSILSIWVGEEIILPILTVAAMGIYTLITVWNNIYAFFLNGVGYIRLSMYITIIIAVINIPISFVMVKYFNLGLNGVILSNIICLFASAIIGPYQTYKVLNSIDKPESLSKIWK